ncbi:MAG: peptide deformylase [Verrucomicrobia bacterium]|nr:peptide deformylase [Verrucomicrobiota bacterium]
MSLPIVRYNDPVLRKKGARVTAFDAALAELSRQMVATMHAAHGIGLAAQQIGRALQLCVVDLRDVEGKFKWTLDGARPPLELFMPMTLVNPEVTVARGTEQEIYEEGCLSFPQIRGDVERPVAITVKYQDERGVPHELACDGLLARCIQHEVDHLNGVLFIDRMDKKVRATLDDAIKALAKATREAAKQSVSP